MSTIAYPKLSMHGSAPRWPLKKWLSILLVVVVELALLYCIGLVYVIGDFWVGFAATALWGVANFIYLHPSGYTYRYLFPGLFGMGLFVLFPLLYTFYISLTNYSSKHLLTFDRSLNYFTSQSYIVEGSQTLSLDLYKNAAGLSLLFKNPDGSSGYIVNLPQLPETALEVEATPATAEQIANLGQMLALRDIVTRRAALRLLTVRLADSDKKLVASGLREFAELRPLFTLQEDGALLNNRSGEILTPNRKTGYFEDKTGTPVPPGFRVVTGFNNYLRVFTDPGIQEVFWKIFAWTVLFAFLTVILAFSVGMFLATLLNWEKLGAKKLYRTLLILPYAVPSFISIQIFKGIFNKDFGELNIILDGLFGIKPDWFGDPFLAKSMLLIVNTWLGFPYMMLLSLGLLQSVSSDLYEASAIEGAGAWTNFSKITMPLIFKPMMPLLISAFAFNFNNFVLIALLTGGRPGFIGTTLNAGETDILVSFTYRLAFEGGAGQDFGLAGTIATCIFVLVAGISYLNLRLTSVKPERA
jgi:maltose/maltodextrin transport system permease protein